MKKLHEYHYTSRASQCFCSLLSRRILNLQAIADNQFHNRHSPVKPVFEAWSHRCGRLLWLQCMLCHTKTTQTKLLNEDFNTIVRIFYVSGVFIYIYIRGVQFVFENRLCFVCVPFSLPYIVIFYVWPLMKDKKVTTIYGYFKCWVHSHPSLKKAAILNATDISKHGKNARVLALPCYTYLEDWKWPHTLCVQYTRQMFPTSPTHALSDPEPGRCTFLPLLKKI